MRRILVTGANKGIGHAIAKAILDEHADTFVYLGSRDAKRGAEAAASLPKDRVEVLELDVASDASVAAAASKLKGVALYGIVNNAGVGHGSADLAAMLETNVLGVQRVCAAFLPSVEKNGRIVNVTSASGPLFVSNASDDQKRFFLDASQTWPKLKAFIDEARTKGGSGGDAYGLSKACANLYTLILAREHPELQINACTPGFIATDMTSAFTSSQGKSAEELGMKPPSAGARAPMHLLFGQLEGTGRYYGSDAKRSPLDRYRAPGSAEYTGD